MLAREQVVERHREAALGLAAQPEVVDAADLPSLLDGQIAGAQHDRPIPGLLQPRARLPHLADRAALERELSRQHDGLVADVERAQPDRVPARHPGAADAEHGDPPRMAMALGKELAQQVGNRVRLADRVARDERDAAGHAVGHERAPLGVEEVRLVAPQREVAQRVAPVALDDATGVGARALGLVDGPGTRPQGEPQHVRGRGDRGGRDAQREVVLEPPRMIARVEPDEAERDGLERVDEREVSAAERGMQLARGDPVAIQATDREQRG